MNIAYVVDIESTQLFISFIHRPQVLFAVNQELEEDYILGSSSPAVPYSILKIY